MSLHYGKHAVRFYRTDGRTTLFAAEVALDVSGSGFLPAYTRGDNSMVVPTDTMNNFVHATALEYSGTSLEEFLGLLGRRFLETYRHVEHLRLRARELGFGRASPVLFQRLHDDYEVAELVMDRGGIREHRSGREALHLVKITGSSFAEFLRDGYTTLPEAAGLAPAEQGDRAFPSVAQQLPLPGAGPRLHQGRPVLAELVFFRLDLWIALLHFHELLGIERAEPGHPDDAETIGAHV